MITKPLAVALAAAVSLAAPAKPPPLLVRVAALEAQVKSLSASLRVAQDDLADVHEHLMDLAARLDALEGDRPPPPKRRRDAGTAAGTERKPIKANRCEATATTTGKRCRAPAMQGSRFCMWHDEHGPTINPFNPD